MAGVTISGLRKTHGSTIALQGLDMAVEDGEFLVVLGPSGSGKSTMLKIIAGIEAASGGSVHFGDRDVTQLPPERRDVAMVFQSYALYPTMTVFDNIAFPLRLRKEGRAEIDKRVRETAALLGIEGLLDRRPRALSGGERQRVAVGRAIVRRPSVFLFDEPLSNLDAHLRAGMRQELKQVHSLLGTTFIYVTHDQDDALDMGDRIAVMRGGRLEQLSTAAELYSEPANSFIASFIGHPPMNLVEGRLVRGSQPARFEADGLTVDLAGQGDGVEAGPVQLGIRPDAATIRPASDGAVGRGLVESISALGYRRAYATVRIGDQPVVVRVPVDGSIPAVGDEVELGLDVSELHLFDSGSGGRVGGATTAEQSSEARAR